MHCLEKRVGEKSQSLWPSTSSSFASGHAIALVTLVISILVLSFLSSIYPSHPKQTDNEEPGQSRPLTSCNTLWVYLTALAMSATAQEVDLSGEAACEQTKNERTNEGRPLCTTAESVKLLQSWPNQSSGVSSLSMQMYFHCYGVKAI